MASIASPFLLGPSTELVDPIRLTELAVGPCGSCCTVDDINPALPLIRNLPKFRSLGSLR